VRGENRGGGRILQVRGGYVSITSIRTGITPSDATGTLLVLNTDFRLLPYDAALNNRPYTSIELTYPLWGAPRSVKITGKRGYSVEMNAEVWNAIRMLAASMYLEALKEGKGGKLVEWTDGDGVHERRSIELIQKWGSTWSTRAKDILKRYTRLN
jgi:hypothetical protein